MGFLSKISQIRESLASELPVFDARVKNVGNVTLPENPRRFVGVTQDNMPALFYSHGR